MAAASSHTGLAQAATGRIPAYIGEAVTFASVAATGSVSATSLDVVPGGGVHTPAAAAAFSIQSSDTGQAMFVIGINPDAENATLLIVSE